MAVHYRTLGFIFKKTDRGEADQLFTIFTKDFGKLEILGKAIRKIKSKLRSGAELFYFSEIEFIQGKTHKTLTDAILIEKFENIKKDLGKLKIAHKITDVVDGLVGGQEKDENIFNLLNEVFKRLNNLKLETENLLKTPHQNSFCSFGTRQVGNQPFGESALHPEKLEIIYYYFFWNFFSILGYKPQLYNCILCEEKLTPQGLYWSLEDGGVICEDCFNKKNKKKEIQKLNADVVKILRLFLKKDWKTLSRLKMEETYQKSLKLISESYLANYKKENKS